MHHVLEQVQNVMAFPLLLWYFVGFEPERASQVVLIKPTDRLQWGSHLKTPVWIHSLVTGAPLDPIRYGVTPAFGILWGVHNMSCDQITP